MTDALRSTRAPPAVRRRGRPPGTTGATRAKCLALYARGRSVQQIAAALAISKQAVSRHLRSSGHDPLRRVEAAAEADRERFRSAWEAAPTLAEAARALGLTGRETRLKAAGLRARGVPLKHFPAPRRRGSKADRITALVRRGLGTKEIARRLGVSPGYVSTVRRRLPGGRLLQSWTPAEDALFRTLDAEGVAARTGRTVDAARVRLRRLRQRGAVTDTSRHAPRPRSRGP
jgi:DNA-binding CsgD family transcriptional regulator